MFVSSTRPSTIACVIGRSDSTETRGTAFVVYEDIYDAKTAVDHLSGFNVGGRYLVALYYQPNKVSKQQSMEKKREEVEALRARFGRDE
jgi:pre-mRNA branch site protein p14